MKRVRHSESAFTLTELLIVIVIIVILAGLILAAVHKAREKGRQANCRSNLHQISLAITMHQDDHEEQFPPWLSTLCPRYMPIGRPEVFICKSDGARGVNGSKPGTAASPDEEYVRITGDSNQFEETDDTSSNTDPANTNRTAAIKACSYMYECCAAECNTSSSWDWASYLGASGATLAEVDRNGDGRASWAEVKDYQLKHGDITNGGKPYDPTIFPIVRCFYHYKENKFNVVNPDSGKTEEQGLTLNVAYAGNVFDGPLHWELLGGKAIK